MFFLRIFIVLYYLGNDIFHLLDISLSYVIDLLTEVVCLTDFCNHIFKKKVIMLHKNSHLLGN